MPTSNKNGADALAGRRHRIWRFLREGPWADPDPIRQLQVSLFLLIALVSTGVIGYMLLEGMSELEATYMTVITLTTVGFGEIQPLGDEGRVFTIWLILAGVGVGAYAARNVLEIAFGDRLWHTLGERRMQQRIAGLDNHFIICGYGRMGREIANEFARHGVDFLVIDSDPDFTTQLLEQAYPHLIGDATLDEVLIHAGIERATGLLAVVDSDADNVLIVLSARGLNPAVRIVARAATHEIEGKLRRAGANSVTSPYVIGGQRMAFALMRPAVYEFLNEVVYSEALHSEMGQLQIQPGSSLLGRSLSECALRQNWGAIIVAIVDNQHRITISPDPHRRLEAGDTLIFVAPRENVARLEEGQLPLDT